MLPDITLVGANSAATTSCSIPTHAIGDFIYCWALRSGSATPPTLPAGFMLIRSGGIGTATAASAILGFKVATATNDANGTWTNATATMVLVYRPPPGFTILIGQTVISAISNANITFPTIPALVHPEGTSWVAAFTMVSNAGQNLTQVPAGLTEQQALAGSTFQGICYDSGGGVTNWPATFINNTGLVGESVTVVAEMALSPIGIGPSPNVYQHVPYEANIFTRGQIANTIKIPLIKPSGTGNCLVLRMSYDGGATLTSVVGAVNGTLPAPAVSALNGAASQQLDSVVIVLPNMTAGQETLTVTFSANVTVFRSSVTEYYGVATSSPVNGTSSIALSPTTVVPAFTPGNNNSNGGNIVDTYFIKSDKFPGQQTFRIFAESDATLLNADIAWINANNSLPSAAQTMIQTTSASISPFITSVDETGDNWAGLSVALKLSPGAGTAPDFLIGPYSIHHFTTLSFPATGVYALQVACVGNLRAITSVDQNLNTITIWDSEGGLWLSAGAGTGWWYRANTSPNPNLIIYINGGGADNGLSWRFWDIDNAAASPFDSASLTNQGANGLSSITLSPSPTPVGANGMVCVSFGLGQGPGLGITAPSGGIWVLTTYAGELDTDTMENADASAWFPYTTAGAKTVTVSITSQVSNSTSGGTVVFLGRTAGPAETVLVGSANLIGNAPSIGMGLTPRTA